MVVIQDEIDGHHEVDLHESMVMPISASRKLVMIICIGTVMFHAT